MAQVPAKCSFCGDIIQVNNEQDAALCPSCNRPIIVKNALADYEASGGMEMMSGLEVVDDDIHVDDLLNLALEDVDNGRYADAAEDITHAMERGPVDPMFRELRLVCQEFASGSEGYFTSEIFEEVVRHVKRAHEMIVSWKDSDGDMETARMAYDRIVNGAASAALEMSKKIPQFLPNEKMWKEAVDASFRVVNTIDDFLSWGTKCGFFNKAHYGLSPRGHETHTWAVSALTLMHAVSLCYREEQTITQNDAQTCYVLAKKFRDLGWLNKEAALAPRVIPPYVKGGEGVHSHRILREEIVNGVLHKSYKSVSDKDYYSVVFQRLRKECTLSGVIVKYTGCSIISGLAIFVCAILVISYSISHNEFLLSPGASVLLAFFLLALIVGVYAFGPGALKGKVLNLYAMWSNSPAHGTKTKNLLPRDFFQVLGPEAKGILDVDKAEETMLTTFMTENAAKTEEDESVPEAEDDFDISLETKKAGIAKKAEEARIMEMAAMAEKALEMFEANAEAEANSEEKRTKSVEDLSPVKD